MKILSVASFSHQDNSFYLIRVDPENLFDTIGDILHELSDLSWLSKLTKHSTKSAFLVNASKTIDALNLKFSNVSDASSIKKECGEYIVSVLSKNAVITIFKHCDVPLMELLGMKSLNNQGFDFYTEKKETLMLYCGEAKYVTGRNAHSSCMRQINEFIDQKKHVSDLIIIDNFIENETSNKAAKNIIGATVAFSCLKTQSDNDLTEKIKSNPNFDELTNKTRDLIFVGVVFHD